MSIKMVLVGTTFLELLERERGRVEVPHSYVGRLRTLLVSKVENFNIKNKSKIKNKFVCHPVHEKCRKSLDTRDFVEYAETIAGTLRNTYDTGTISKQFLYVSKIFSLYQSLNKVQDCMAFSKVWRWSSRVFSKASALVSRLEITVFTL